MNVFLYYILPFVCVLGILIFFHELGHFLVAKFFKVKVLTFSLGFGPKLVSRRRGETEYVISALPLGGYVKMLGENTDDDTESLSPAEAARAFSNQSVGKRLAIVGAGPLFNLLLALIIFIFFYMFAGTQVLTSEVGQVTPDSPAAEAGIQKGDVLVAVDDTPIAGWNEIRKAVAEHMDRPMEITILREGRRVTVTLQARISSTKNLFGEEVKTPLIGIVSSGEFRQVSLGPVQAMMEGIGRTWEITRLTVMTIVKLFQRILPMSTIGGPIMIGQLTGQLAQESLIHLIPFIAIISVNLFVLNLLPIPVLDGGVILFLLIEAVSGRPLSLKKREYAQKFGLVLLLTLMAVVIYNDMARILQ
ncbi:MAG TPA: RIP metalloprotease RseP [Desulfobacteraceae bacterium]|jgi:regulator of sigma E protease|nr:RIP metalloprotease RseP [Desulfobacteraceae bacterium]